MISLISTEFTKAAWRTRTLIVAFVLIALPTAIAIAVSTGSTNDEARGEDVLFSLTEQSGLLVPVALLNAMGGFFLMIVSGTFAGDSVAGDAAWGNLRYVLMRPVGRARLLVAKALVADVLIWAATILLVIASLVAGLLLFGADGVTVPARPDMAGGIVGAFDLTSAELLLRLGVATAYVAFGYTALLAIGTFLSTLTDTAAGAISATVGIYIVTMILDGISALGRFRYLLPTHYLTSWSTMFTEDRFSQDMVAGIVVQLSYLAVFGAAALVWFHRKDIRS